jgi:hypothetical protein
LSARASVVVALAALAAGTTACNRPLLEREKTVEPRISQTIPPDRFHVLAGIAGGATRTDLQISATVRQRMQDSGFTMLRWPGRWENMAEAVRRICAPGQTPAVDGVLFIWYNRLELRDCMTEGAAFQIGGEGAAQGITAMVDRLVNWLKRDRTSQAQSTP